MLEISKNNFLKKKNIIGGRIFESKEEHGKFQVAFKIKGSEQAEFSSKFDSYDLAKELLLESVED